MSISANGLKPLTQCFAIVPIMLAFRNEVEQAGEGRWGWFQIDRHQSHGSLSVVGGFAYIIISKLDAIRLIKLAWTFQFASFRRWTGEDRRSWVACSESRLLRKWKHATLCVFGANWCRSHGCICFSSGPWITLMLAFVYREKVMG